MKYLLRILCVFLMASGGLCTTRRYIRPDLEELLNDVLDKHRSNSKFSSQLNVDNLNNRKVQILSETPETNQPEIGADGEENVNAMADQMEGSDGPLLDGLEGREQFDGGKGNANLATYEDIDIIREALQRLERYRSRNVVDRKNICGKDCDKAKFRGPTEDYTVTNNHSGRRVAQKGRCGRDCNKAKFLELKGDNSVTNNHSGRRVVQKGRCGRDCVKAKFRGPTEENSAANNHSGRRVAQKGRCGRDCDKAKFRRPTGDYSVTNNHWSTILDPRRANLRQDSFDARKQAAIEASNQLRQNRMRHFSGQMERREGTSSQNVRPNYHGEVDPRKRNGVTKIFQVEQAVPSAPFWGLPHDSPLIRNELNFRQYVNEENPWPQYKGIPELHSINRVADDLSNFSEKGTGLPPLRPTLKPEDIKQYENVLKYRPFTRFDAFLKERNKFCAGIAQKRSQTPALHQDRSITSNMEINKYDNTHQSQRPNPEPDFWQLQKRHEVPLSRYQILNQALISQNHPPNQVLFSSNQPSNRALLSQNQPPNRVLFSSNQPSNRALLSKYQPSIQDPVLPYQPPNQASFSPNQPPNKLPISSNQPSHRTLFSKFQPSFQDPVFPYQPINQVPFASNQPPNQVPVSSNQPSNRAIIVQYQPSIQDPVLPNQPPNQVSFSPNQPPNQVPVSSNQPSNIVPISLKQPSIQDLVPNQLSNTVPVSSNQPTNTVYLQVPLNQPSNQALVAGEQITLSPSKEPGKKEILCKEWTVKLVQDPKGAPTLRLVNPNKQSGDVRPQDQGDDAQKRDPNQKPRPGEQWTIALRQEPNKVPILELRPRQKSEQAQPLIENGPEELTESQGLVGTTNNIESAPGVQKQWIIALKQEPDKPPLLAIKPVSREEQTLCRDHSKEPPGQASKSGQLVDAAQQNRGAAPGESRTLQMEAPRRDSTQSEPVRNVASLQQASSGPSKPAVNQTLICEWKDDEDQANMKQKLSHPTKALRRQTKKKVFHKRRQKHVNLSLALGGHDQSETYKKREVDAHTRFRPQNLRQKQWR